MSNEDLLAKRTLAELQEEIRRTSSEAKRKECVREFFEVGHDRSRATEEEILPLIETILRVTTKFDNHGEYRGQFPSLLKFAGNEESLGLDGGDAYSSAARLVRDHMRRCAMELSPDDPMHHAGITKAAMFLEGIAAQVILRRGRLGD